MSTNVKNIFDSFKESSGIGTESRKVVYTNNDISELLDNDSFDTTETLEKIFKRSKTLINKYRKNKKNIFEEAILKKNKSVCDFIISKDYFSEMWSGGISDIIQVDFYEIFGIYNKHQRMLNQSTWSEICSSAKSATLVTEIVKNQRGILKDISDNDILNSLCRFIYCSSDSVKPLLYVEDLLTQERKNALWRNMLRYCNSPLMHQSLIDIDIIPDTVMFEENPLLLFVLHQGNTKIFDYYSKNEILFNQAVEYLKDEKNKIFKLNKYTTKTECKKLLSLYKEIDLSKRESILPDLSDFNYSKFNDIKYFLEMVASEPQINYFLYKIPNRNSSKNYLECLFEMIKKEASDSEIKELRAYVEKNYLGKAAGIDKIKSNSEKTKRL